MFALQGWKVTAKESLHTSIQTLGDDIILQRQESDPVVEIGNSKKPARQCWLAGDFSHSSSLCCPHNWVPQGPRSQLTKSKMRDMLWPCAPGFFAIRGVGVVVPGVALHGGPSCFHGTRWPLVPTPCHTNPLSTSAPPPTGCLWFHAVTHKIPFLTSII